MFNKTILRLVQNLSLSYEISLAIGQSLELKEMLNKFINTLVRKTAAHRGTIWLIQDGSIKYITGAGSGTSEFTPRAITPSLENILDEILDKEILIVNSDSPGFNTICCYRNGREKEILLMAIKNTLLIHLVFGRKGIAKEGIVSVLKSLGPKLVNAVKACLNYQKVLQYEQKEKQRLENALQQTEERYRLLTEKALVGVFLIQNRLIKYANPKLAQIFGYNAGETLHNKEFVELAANDNKPKVSAWLEKFYSGCSTEEHIIFSAVRKDGSVFYCECLGSRTEHNGKPAIVGTLNDVTIREQEKEKLQHLAEHDGLTGVYNRRYLEEILSSLKNNPHAYPLTIILFDIDHLKEINDYYGHQMGDKVIRNAAFILQKCLRKIDVLGRYGSDEFLALLPNTNAKTAESIINKIKDYINNDSKKQQDVLLSISMGFGTAENKDQLDKAFNQADSNMYISKALKTSFSIFGSSKK